LVCRRGCCFTYSPPPQNPGAILIVVANAHAKRDHSSDEDEAMKILLAIDGSGHSEAAVDEIAHGHFVAESEVRVISVVETSYAPATLPGEGVNLGLYAVEIENAARERARSAVDKAAATLRAHLAHCKLKVTTDVFAGSPKRMILEEAEAFGADLIVVGSHGHGNFERFLLGSVSQSVALHARCSVEIVRRLKTQASERMEHDQ
jgi:nucleotide-binding universal stress UspA family protein